MTPTLSGGVLDLPNSMPAEPMMPSDCSAIDLEHELRALLGDDQLVRDFICDQVLDGVWIWDLENRANSWANPQFWRRLGYDPDDLSPEMAWTSMIDSSDLEAISDAVARRQDDDLAPIDLATRYRHQSGTTIWLRCRAIVIGLDGGTARRLIGAHFDMTAQISTSMQAKREVDEAKLANRDLKAFAYAISHDLKGPANTLKMLFDELEIQLGKANQGETATLISMGQDCVQGMRNLIDDVHDYTNLISDTASPRDVNLREVLAEILTEIEGRLNSTGARVELGDLPLLIGEAHQVKLLFWNLLDNALKFQHPGNRPLIRISAEAPNAHGFAPISVQDNGIGIDPIYLDRVFDMFFRLHTASDFPGNGLGLTICRRVVRNHGGQILAQSAPDRGTEIVCWLPGVSR